ncbi:hypothetical protein H5410_040324 [Solanum commersonii]|uniref:Uncharacterized protein n=1 Tax=Solanum commersonii TaxID=4109 RepID=A0A9J5XPT4_SOLCO|nr:hypothetical protein H5410_040324 [Solanum commersonii]
MLHDITMHNIEQEEVGRIEDNEVFGVTEVDPSEEIQNNLPFEADLSPKLIQFRGEETRGLACSLIGGRLVGDVLRRFEERRGEGRREQNDEGKEIGGERGNTDPSQFSPTAARLAGGGDLERRMEGERR